jgi:hypothetical protein
MVLPSERILDELTPQPVNCEKKKQNSRANQDSHANRIEHEKKGSIQDPTTHNWSLEGYAELECEAVKACPI